MLCGVALDDEVVTGVTAMSDLDAVLATGPECVVHCAMGDTRLPDAAADVMRILAAGVNVVGSSPGPLQYPWGVLPDKYIARVEDAARQGDSSIFSSGVGPGVANGLIPSALAGTCRRIEQVRCTEIPTTPATTALKSCTWASTARSTRSRCCCDRACPSWPSRR